MRPARREAALPIMARNTTTTTQGEPSGHPTAVVGRCLDDADQSLTDARPAAMAQASRLPTGLGHGPGHLLGRAAGAVRRQRRRAPRSWFSVVAGGRTTHRRALTSRALHSDRADRKRMRARRARTRPTAARAPLR